MENAYIYDTKIGRLMTASNLQAVTGIYFENQIDDKSYIIAEDDIHRQAIAQINEYLDGKRKTFDITLDLKGTEFQKRVWNVLLDIPYGKTASYKDVAYRAGNDKACRAVGMANNRNPIPIIIPCHRVNRLKR